MKLRFGRFRRNRQPELASGSQDAGVITPEPLKQVQADFWLKQLAMMVLNYIIPPRCLSCLSLGVISEGFCEQCWNLIEFISKPYCNICGYQFGFTTDDELICGRCLTKKPLFSTIRSLIKFDENSKKVIHAFKYYDKTGVAGFFARLLYDRYILEIAHSDIIIPVPMHKLKRLLRMYNQAHILAKELAKIAAKPLYTDLLLKTKWTKSQASLTKKEREKSLSGSFSVNIKYMKSGFLKDKKVLLVDDVITTASTIKECSRMLKKAGASEVHVITIART